MRSILLLIFAIAHVVSCKDNASQNEPKEDSVASAETEDMANVTVVEGNGDDEFVTAETSAEISGANLVDAPLVIEKRVVSASLPDSEAILEQPLVNGRQDLQLALGMVHTGQLAQWRMLIPPHFDPTVATAFQFGAASHATKLLFDAMLIDPNTAPLLAENLLNYASLMRLGGTLGNASRRAQKFSSVALIKLLAGELAAQNAASVKQLIGKGSNPADIRLGIAKHLQTTFEKSRIETFIAKKTYDQGVLAAETEASIEADQPEMSNLVDAVVKGALAAAPQEEGLVELTKEFVYEEKITELAQENGGLVSESQKSELWESVKSSSVAELEEFLNPSSEPKQYAFPLLAKASIKPGPEAGSVEINITLPSDVSHYKKIAILKSKGTLAPCNEDGAINFTDFSNSLIQHVKLLPEADTNYSFRICVYDKALKLQESLDIKDIRTTAQRIFITSEGFQGDLDSDYMGVSFSDGIAGANGRCMKIAANAGLEGTWIALLGNSTMGARERSPLKGRLFNLGGEVVANDASELWSGTLTNKVTYNETGVVATHNQVWSGVKATGASGAHCLDWTTNSSSQKGQNGVSTSDTSTWVNTNAWICNSPFRLYCMSSTEVIRDAAPKDYIEDFYVYDESSKPQGFLFSLKQIWLELNMLSDTSAFDEIKIVRDNGPISLGCEGGGTVVFSSTTNLSAGYSGYDTALNFDDVSYAACAFKNSVLVNEITLNAKRPVLSECFDISTMDCNTHCSLAGASCVGVGLDFPSFLNGETVDDPLCNSGGGTISFAQNCTSVAANHRTFCHCD
jgi:hypothetical protein